MGGYDDIVKSYDGVSDYGRSTHRLSEPLPILLSLFALQLLLKFLDTVLPNTRL